MTAFTKAGFTSSVNVRVYGTYRFKSFESSPIAGNFDLIDMVSFRELYGFMTDERRKETEELEKEMGVANEDRDAVEKLFSEKTPVIATGNNEKTLSIPTKFAVRNKDVDTHYSPDEMEGGIFLHAAVVLKDRSEVDKTIRMVQQVSKEHGLGIQTASWLEAAGLVGQLIYVIRIILYSCAFILFVIAAFIILNSMLMATIERNREIGTMRAIGAQKSFVLRLFLGETICLSAIFGLVGSLLGIATIGLIGWIGIPGKGDVAAFFFSGPRLYLSVNWLQVVIALVAMALVSIIATQYPAWRATRISPLQAMQKNE
ncbi:MAG: ABC transporter permease [Deltaproteobacteria bacterium]|nr:ABC transporter permease [Deltaproteobacteria bacterium]